MQTTIQLIGVSFLFLCSTVETLFQPWRKSPGLPIYIAAPWRRVWVYCFMLVALGALFAQADPAITAQPQGQITIAGSAANFSVTASGSSPLSYQWWGNATSLTNGGRVSGATSPTLTITNLNTNDFGVYYVVVTNLLGAVTSSVAPLTVTNAGQPIGINTYGIQSGTLQIVSGTGAFASVSATHKVLNIAAGASLTGAVNLQAYNDAPAQDVTPLIYTPSWGVPSNSWQTINGSIATGTSAQQAQVSVTAPTTPGVYHLIFAFQWEVTGDEVASASNWTLGYDVWDDGNDVADWEAAQLAQAQADGYTVNLWLFPVSSVHPLGYGAEYVPADAITVVVGEGVPVISQQPQGHVGFVGDTATFSATASGSSPLIYQWWGNAASLTNGGRISGATGPTLTITNLNTNDFGIYYVVVTNIYGSATSTVAPLTVNNPGQPTGINTYGLQSGTLQISSGSGSFASISATNKILNVAPGASLTGAVNLQANNNAPSQDVTPLIYTPSWGVPSNSWQTINGWISTGTSAQQAQVSVTAPATPGQYHLIFAFQWEVTGDEVASASNWTLGYDVWGDGNDVADWDASQLAQAQADGYTVNLWLYPVSSVHPLGYAPEYVPADAVTINVTGVQTGSLEVTIEPTNAASAGAQWQVDGGAFQNSGAVVSGLSVGSHTLAFSTISGWTTPTSQTVTINSNLTTMATGTYVAIPPTGSLQVTIDPAGAVDAGARWQVDGGTLRSSGMTQTNLSVGSHTVAFLHISGWGAPSNQVVLISTNETTRIMGIYQEQGSLKVVLSPVGAILAGAEWQVDGGAYLASGATLSALNQGPHTVSFKPISGWLTPQSQNLTILGEQTNAATGVYVAISYIFTTIAGKPGEAGYADNTNNLALFDDPLGITVAANGALFIADTDNSVIRSLTPSGTNRWVSGTIAGLARSVGDSDGSNSLARFNYPSGVAVDNHGHVFVADQVNSTIRQITLAAGTGVVSTVTTTIAGLAGNEGSADGTNSVAQFYYPADLAVDPSGNVYVADQANSTIRKLTALGSNNWAVATVAGTAGETGNVDGTNANARFDWPGSIAVDTNGNLYVADTFNDTIRKITVSGTNYVVTTICGNAGVNGAVDGTNYGALFDGPSGIAADSLGNVFVVDSYSSLIRKVIPVGTNWVVKTVGGLAYTIGTQDGTNAGARFDSPAGICVDSNGNLYVADTDNQTIRMGVPDPPKPQSFPLAAMPQPGAIPGLSWSAILGMPYQVQYTTSLQPPNWINLGDPVLATSSPMPYVDTLATDSQRFYRVILIMPEVGQ